MPATKSNNQGTTIVYPSVSDQILQAELDRRDIRITGEISSEVAHVTQAKLDFLAGKSKEPITIWLNTPGGGILDGLAIYDAILRVRAKGVKVRIVATGMCMSMGAIIMQAASERCSEPHAAFLLHELHMLNIGSLGQLTDKHKEALRLQDLLNNIIIKRSGMTKPKLHALVARKDVYLPASEMKKLGLIDTVI